MQLCPARHQNFIGWLRATWSNLPRMSVVRRAVIDVGTNSVKLLVAEINGREIRPLIEESTQTRLGQGFYETRQLLPAAIHHTAQAVTDFANKARSYSCEEIRIIATSAARDAINADALIIAIEQQSQLPLEIISGEQEADWAFQGVTTDPSLADIPLLLLDVGGGSTEFILGRGERQFFRQSFPLGTVRLLETIRPSDPPMAQEFSAARQQTREFIATKVRPVLMPVWQREIQPAAASITLVGTGGTSTILARMEAQLHTFDRATIEDTRISFDRLQWHTERLWRLPLARREEVVGLPRKRADVILTGTVIYEAIMELFQLPELRVSTRGLRFAAVLDAH